MNLSFRLFIAALSLVIAAPLSSASGTEWEILQNWDNLEELLQEKVRSYRASVSELSAAERQSQAKELHRLRQLAQFKSKMDHCFQQITGGTEEERLQVQAVMTQGALKTPACEIFDAQTPFNLAQLSQVHDIEQVLSQFTVPIDNNLEGSINFINEARQRAILHNYQAMTSLEDSLGLPKLSPEEYLSRVCGGIHEFPCTREGKSQMESAVRSIPSSSSPLSASEVTSKVRDQLGLIHEMSSRVIDAVIDHGTDSPEFASAMEVYQNAAVTALSEPQGMVLLFPPLRRRWDFLTSDYFYGLEERIRGTTEYHVAQGNAASDPQTNDFTIQENYRMAEQPSARDFRERDIRRSGEAMRSQLVDLLQKSLIEPHPSTALRSLAKHQPFALGSTLVLRPENFNEVCSALKAHFRGLDNSRQTEGVIDTALQAASIASLGLTVFGGAGLGISSLIRTSLAARAVGATASALARAGQVSSAALLRAGAVAGVGSSVGYVAQGSGEIVSTNAERSELLTRAWADGSLNAEALERLSDLDADLQGAYATVGFDLFSLIPLGTLTQHSGGLYRRFVRELSEEIAGSPRLATRIRALRGQPALRADMDAFLLMTSELDSSDRRLILGLFERGDENLARRLIARHRSNPSAYRACSALGVR